MVQNDDLTRVYAELELRKRERERARIEKALSWAQIARPDQLPPPGDWLTWLVLGGRGAGKTRTGAEWLFEKSKTCPRLAIVAATFGDGRDTCIEGESGLWEHHRDHIETWNRSMGELRFTNGSQLKIFSGDEPEQLRGPQHHAAWIDEPIKFKYLDESWDNLMFGLRLGENPQVVMTTTPKPIKFLKTLIADETTVTTRTTTYANRANLSPKFFAKVIKKYEGTNLGRQELEGQIIEDVEGALWKRAWIDSRRISILQLPGLVRVVLACDPATTAHANSDFTALAVVGISSDGEIYVLEALRFKENPDVWASELVRIFHKWKCDRVVVEGNQGGELVRSVIHHVQRIPVEIVHHKRGKVPRAEPAALLYEQGHVHHVGYFMDLEDQMCAFPIAHENDDDVDALSTAINTLTLNPSQSSAKGQTGKSPAGNLLKERF